MNSFVFCFGDNVFSLVIVFVAGFCCLLVCGLCMFVFTQFCLLLFV